MHSVLLRYLTVLVLPGEITKRTIQMLDSVHTVDNLSDQTGHAIWQNVVFLLHEKSILHSADCVSQILGNAESKLWCIKYTVCELYYWVFLFCTSMFNGSVSQACDEMMINSLRRSGNGSGDSALKVKQFTSVKTLSPLKQSNLNRDKANTVPKLQ